MATISTKELAALAFAAFRFNKGFLKDSTKFDEATETFVEVTPNKILMHNTVTNKKDKLVLAVTDEDRQQAESVINALHGDITLKLLMGKRVSDFVQNLNNAVSKESCTASDCGIVAWLPEMHDRITKEQSSKEQMFELGVTSEYIGTIDQKVTIDFTVINSRFLRDYDCYSVFGHDNNGNCVSFFTRKSDMAKDGKITGKVKSHKTDDYHNGAKVTTINYVKGAQ
ncbi:hypothetical protein UFOVP257_167 [uncultured Caudovirales phage]|uniref:Uncharacterized protein n=1 Tax=uncultured Caudovirales phage TaxID=2100421 RepID=A0A6J5LJY8_9CAUD|nr:hypothetical protein UFOVP257_167 [uncultured Caudovirales phage]